MVKVLLDLDDYSSSEPSPGPQNLHLSKGFGAEVKVLEFFSDDSGSEGFSADFGQMAGPSLGTFFKNQPKSPGYA